MEETLAVSSGTPAPLSAPQPADPADEAPSTRGRLYEALLRVPGLHLARLAREAGVPEAAARYHMRHLVRSGLAIEEGPEGSHRYFPRRDPALGAREVDRRDKPVLAMLRRPVPLRMVAELLVHPEHRLSMGELAQAARVSAPNAHYHVGRMARLGLVVVSDQGRQRIVALVEPERIRNLLARFPPPRDLVQSFTDVWDRLG